MNWVKKCFLFLLKQYENLYLKKYYSSIHEMPIENWIKLHDNNDHLQLSKNGKCIRFIEKAYERLEDSFIDTFGVGKDFFYIQGKKIEIELMYCKQIQTGDYSNQIFIELLESDLEKITSKKGGNSKIIKLIPWVEFEMGGMSINTKETTVFEFYSRVNFIVEKNAK